MKKQGFGSLDRRQFCSRVPAAAAFCLGCSQGWALAASGTPAEASTDGHPFEQEMPPMTFYQWMQQRHRKYIGILTRMKEEVGDQKLLDLLKKASFAENVELGRRLSGRIDSIEAFADPFRDPDSFIGKTIVREIVTDTDTVFEMKITECVTERVFREEGASDLGYACVCHADFGLPEGLDIDIRLERSKTLMQGHGCCNHRYVLMG